MAILRQMVDQGGAPPLEVRSAGTLAAPGLSMNEMARRVLARRGIADTGDHRSSPLASLAPWADLIFTMTRGHREDVLAAHPELEGKVFVLGQWALPGEWDLRQRQLAALWGETGPLEQLQAAEGALASLEVADPFGGDEDQYEAAARQLEFFLQQAALRLQTGFPAAEEGPAVTGGADAKSSDSGETDHGENSDDAAGAESGSP